MSTARRVGATISASECSASSPRLLCGLRVSAVQGVLSFGIKVQLQPTMRQKATSV
jgi:hypothetical protein